MSRNAQHICRDQVVRLATMNDQQEQTLLTGAVRNRVSGARNRVKWWLRVAADHRPAMTVLNSLYYLGSGKGVGSPFHTVISSDLRRVIKLWPTPLEITHNQAKMFAWWVKATVKETAAADYRLLKNRRLLNILSKVSVLTRWCIITHPHVLDRSGELTHRSVNWEVLSNLTNREKLIGTTECLRTKVLWEEEGFKTPEGMTLLPRDVPMAGLRSLVATIHRYIRPGDQDPVPKPEIFDACLRLALMFGKDTRTALRYVEDFANHNSVFWGGLHMMIHDAAQKLPATKDAKRWKGFVLTSFRSPVFGQLMDNLDVVEEVCGGVPANIGEVKEKFYQAGRTWDFDLNSEERSFVRNTPPKTFERCPHAEVVDGEYRLVKLAYNDTRQLTAGRLVDCCQHLNGAGSACATAAWTSGNCAIYAVFKGDRMVAQTFAWRSTTDEIVFDSVEALSGVNRDKVLPMFVDAADQIVGQLEVRKVLVGATNYGITKDLTINYTDEVTSKPPDSITPLGYSDAKSGCYTLSSQKLKVKYAKTGRDECVETSVRAEVINTLMPGSEVYCEYCDAEVHPACQICPSCDEDISEWVD